MNEELLKANQSTLKYYLSSYKELENGGECRICYNCRFLRECPSVEKLCGRWCNDELGFETISIFGYEKNEIGYWWIGESISRAIHRMVGFAIMEMSILQEVD